MSTAWIRSGGRTAAGRARTSALRGVRTGGAGLVLGSLLALLGACEDHSQVRTIESSRDVSQASLDQFDHASTEERFGMRAPGAPKSSGEEQAPRLAWDIPQGWTEAAPSAMRAANFRVAGDERAECYLTLLTGDAGGLEANIGRWYGQMSKPAPSVAEIAALQRSEFLGRDAVLVDVTGSWMGMSGSEGKEGYRLVGLLLVQPEGSAFLKMVGPDSVVGPQIDAFRSLARSFRAATDAAPASAPPAAASMPADPSVKGAASDLAWKAPESWRLANDRPTRTVSYYVGGGDSVECYVTVLSGSAGGALANVSRWRAQLGRAEISASELHQLPRIPMLDGDGVLVEIEGSGENEGTLLLGAVCERADRSVFVKLSGPRAVVESERENFLAFCRSLSLTR